MTAKITSVEWANLTKFTDPNYQMVLRELCAYDMLCPLCIKFACGKHGDINFQYPPTSLHWSRTFEWPWTVIESGIQPEDEILETGGSGCVLKYALARRCKKVVTLDNSEKNLKEVVDVQFPALRSMVPQLDKVTLVFADIRNIPFLDNTFDVTTCISTLEHTQDHMKCLEELIRVTKPGKPIMISMDVVLQGDGKDEFSIDMKKAHELVGAYGGKVPTEQEGYLARVFNDAVLGCLCFRLEKS